MENITLWITLVVMIIGALGTVIPLIPGTPLILLAALGYGISEGFQQIDWITLVAMGLLTVISILTDYFAGAIGAKSFGAGSYGKWGALIGGLLGFFIFPIGIVLGPLIGAVTGEIMQGKNFKTALHAGIGVLIGIVGGGIFKLLLAIAMIITFLWKIW